MEGLGYVFPHTGRISDFANKNWGNVIKPKDIQSFKAGDIMDKPGHILYGCGPMQ